MMLNEIIVLIFGIIIAVTILLMLRKIFFGSRTNLKLNNMPPNPMMKKAMAKKKTAAETRAERAEKKLADAELKLAAKANLAKELVCVKEKY